MHVATSSPSTEVQALLDAAHRRLPPDVRSFVLANVHFVVLRREDHGQALPLHSIRPGVSWGEPDPSLWWVIFLDEGSLIDVPAEEAHSLIAHEVAHAFSGEGMAHAEVAELASSWGFVGEAADPDRFRE